MSSLRRFREFPLLCIQFWSVILDLDFSVLLKRLVSKSRIFKWWLDCKISLSRDLLVVWSKPHFWGLRPGKLVTREGHVGSNPTPGASAEPTLFIFTYAFGKFWFLLQGTRWHIRIQLQSRRMFLPRSLRLWQWKRHPQFRARITR